MLLLIRLCFNRTIHGAAPATGLAFGVMDVFPRLKLKMR
jgi:hypothetical protein